jgi:hypothetical protein
MDAQDVVAFLVGRGLLQERDLVDGHVTVLEQSGRNRSFAVMSERGRSFFVKQAHAADAQARPRVEREARFYQLVGDDPGGAPLRGHLAELGTFDREASILKLALVPRLAAADDAGDDDDGIANVAGGAEAVAEALAACHMAFRDALADIAFLSRIAPWVLTLARPHPDGLLDLSLGQLAVIRTLQASPELCEALARMHHDWQASTLIHGDVKWANLVFGPGAAGSNRPKVTLVDWESASIGDAAWDVGSMMHCYLVSCIGRATVADDASASTAASTLAEELRAAQIQIAAFWREYTARTALGGSEARAMLDRSVRCCAARLVQTAYEWSQGVNEMPRETVVMLQLAANMAAHPDRARVDVLGIAQA